MMAGIADSIRWGNTRISYEYEFTKRKTLAISVHPDQQIKVKAPVGTDLQIIREKVLKRARWITKALREFDLYLPKQPDRRYISGEAHRYLGRQYRLKAIKGDVEGVKCLRGHFWVTTIDEPSPDKIKALLESWYRDKAKRIFSERLEHCQKKFTRRKVDKPTFSVRKMKTRWGSYSSAGRITLNLELIKAPKDCIDYVIVHELCHMIEPHHGSRFWQLISSFMPDYEDRRCRLNMFADV